jgi:hypothetical protein
MIDYKHLTNSNGYLRKFGRNSDIDITTDPEDIWEGGGLYTFPSDSGEQMYISSSNSGDTVLIKIFGLDSDFNEKELTVALAGQTKTSIPDGVFSRVFRAYNDDSTDLAGDVYIYTDDSVSLGVPSTASKIKAKINQADQQTLMCIFTVPNGKIGQLIDIFGICSKVSGVSNPAGDMKLLVREYGKVFRVRYTFELTDSFYQDQFSTPLMIPEKSDILIRCQTTKDSNTAINAGFDLLFGD